VLDEQHCGDGSGCAVDGFEQTDAAGLPGLAVAAMTNKSGDRFQQVSSKILQR
jgi:hypothetical protein